MTTVRKIYTTLFAVTLAAMLTACDRAPCLTCPTTVKMVKILVSASADASALAVCPAGVVIGTGHGYAEAWIEVPEDQVEAAKTAKKAELQAIANAQATATAVCVTTPMPPTPTPPPTPPPPTPPPPTPPGPTPVNCSVSDWGSWSAWIPINSTTEQRTRSRSVVTPPSNGGQSCPSLTETETRTITPTCTYSVTTNTISVDYRAANGTIAVGASPASCTWTISSTVPWATLGKGSGTGNDSSPYNIAENPTTSVRNGVVTVTGLDGFSKTIPVSQGAKPVDTCSYSFTVPDVFNASKAGADGTIIIGVNGPNPSACTWTITTTQFWIGANPSSGAGNGSSKFTVGGNNTGAIRSGSVTVKGADGSSKTFTVTQGG